MKNCTHCKHASWKRNAAGNLHPSGDGMCTYEYRVPALPASMHWIDAPKPSGGHINRKKELNEHCTYFSREAA